MEIHPYDVSRRNFLRTAGSAMGAGMVLGPSGHFVASAANSSNTSSPESKPQWLVDLIIANDSHLDTLEYDVNDSRVNDKSSPDYGGFLDRFGLPSVNTTQSVITQTLCSVTSPESNYFKSESLMKIIADASAYLVRAQHEDGTVDLLSHNFYSPPDTGFRVKGLVPVFKMLEKVYHEIPGGDEVYSNLETFLQRASRCLLDGGVHTPNHRWAMCEALARVYQLWPEEKYLQRAEQWLAEGIDIDSDGQYRERDTTGYSPLTNRALVTTAQVFDKPELLDHVRRNLDMTLYYITTNGMAVEEVSERVERDGRRMRPLTNQYTSYRHLALLDDNGTFAAACRHIERQNFSGIGSNLDHLIDDPFLWKPLPATKPLPHNYVRAFTDSGVVRIRRGNYDASIISRYTKRGIFFAFHKNEAILWGMRLGSSFSGMGQFESEQIRRDGDAWILEREVEGFYVQPVPEEHTPLGFDWNFDPEFYDTYGLMWHTKNRERTRVHPLKQKAIIREIERGFEIELITTGTDNVPTAVELIFNPGGRFTGLEKHHDHDDTYFLKEGYGRYHAGGNTITFGPGKFLHTNAELRGTLPKMDLPTVLLTGVTPFNHTIRIT